MKNLYVFLLVFCSYCTFAQLQNNHWIFGGNAWLDFSSGSPLDQSTLPSILGPISTEGCASVSDDSGNLLFWTDGESVFRWTGTQIVTYTNGNGQLFGDRSSAQNVIIVPRPNNPGHYYIVTIAGSTTISLPTGLYYSEVDAINNVVIPNVLNVPLLDTNVVPIDEFYGNDSEAVTSALASNGIDYWVVAHIKNSTNSGVLSYSVTENGINLLPNSNTPFAIDQFAYSLKISPDNSHIALSYIASNPFLGTFDNTTGQVSFLSNPVGNLNSDSYGIEFSHDSQTLYWSNSGVYAVNIGNPFQEILITNDDECLGLQLGVDNKIYVAKKNSLNLSVIQSPWTPLSPNYVNNFAITRKSGWGLPQWSPLQAPNTECQAQLILMSMQDDVNNIISEQERSNWIKASNMIFPGSFAATRAIYHAGNFVELLPDFETVTGAEFSAYIEGCSNDFEYRETFALEPKSKVSVMQNLQLYPNPSSTSVLVTFESLLKSVSIMTIDGKRIQTVMVNNTQYQVDVSTLANGIYIISAETQEGKILKSKFIKN